MSSTRIKSKIHDLASLAGIIDSLKTGGKTIVHCHGVFDLLHIGHIRHFEEAKAKGDILVVTLTCDKFVNKGPNRPAFSESLRAEALAALESVDYVAINHAESAVPAIQAVKPNLYVKGPDYANRPAGTPGKLSTEEQVVKDLGGKLVFTEDVQFSSTNLLNRFFPQFSPDINKYLEDFRAKHSLEDVLGAFEKAKKLKVLVIGETIIDDYHYVEAIGKSGKEPVLVTRSISSEQFGGGIIAIANHVAGFCDEVGLLSTLGTVDSFESFARERLKKNVKPTFLFQKGRPTIRKLRYLDHYLVQKLFEIYFIDDSEQIPSEQKEFLTVLEKLIKDYDVVVVADYGHGLLGKHAIELLCSKSKFLCVNTQANAGNRGLHTISLYPRADYAAISEGELRLETRAREGEISLMIEAVKTRFDCPLIMITRGKNGIMCFSDKGGVAEGPGFTQSFVDRVGSGDAVLSVTSPLAAVGASPEILAFVGNLAGSEAVKTVGHRSSLEFNSFKRLLTSLLK